MGETTEGGRLTSERARELSNRGWSHHQTAQSRRLRTLKARIACGKRAEMELNALLREAARSESASCPTVEAAQS